MAKSKNDEEILQDENTESAEQAQAPKRIKLKKETEVLSQEELEAKFGGVDGDEKPTVKKQVKVKGKTTFSLEDYKKDKGVADGAKMKPESWLRMSPAFQQVTGLKGAIVGGINIVHGKSDTSKSTFALELAKFAQEDGTLVCWLITEKKWSRQRCVDMGVDLDKCIVNSDINFIEEGCDFIEELLKDQEEGRLPHDILFIWDSIGATPSKREWESAEEGESGKGMMVTAKVTIIPLPLSPSSADSHSLFDGVAPIESHIKRISCGNLPSSWSFNNSSMKSQPSSIKLISELTIHLSRSTPISTHLCLDHFFSVINQHTNVPSSCANLANSRAKVDFEVSLFPCTIFIPPTIAPFSPVTC